jgi:NAD+ kinase
MPQHRKDHRHEGGTVSNIFVVVHHERPRAVELAEETVAWASRHGHRVWICPDDAVAIARPDLACDMPAADSDLVVCIGGDGTMLRAVGLLDGAPVPLLGVNVGVLGYLTEVEPEQLTMALERAVHGEVRIEPRMMLAVRLVRHDGTQEGPWLAVNEASLEKREAGHTVRLRVWIDGEVFTTYQADGLVVSTPTGSTAYSLSARGPVVSPSHWAVLLTPVAPHQLFDRSLVLGPSEPVEIEVLEHRMVDLAVDGRRVATLVQGDRVGTEPASQTAQFVRLGPDRFHQVLKAKFGLTDR